MGPDPGRIEELFHEVADLDPAEAARRLDEACAGDHELHAAVETLLDHDREAQGEFLAPNPAAIAKALREAREGTTTVPEKDDDGPLPHDPTRLGRFFVLRRLGEGGMGVVYAGYDELLDRRVALKLLRRGSADKGLRREAQALARLAHPNVVAVHEVGDHEGRIFLAMELVEGHSLRAWLEARPSPTEILGVFLQAGHGLAAAHEAGLVHRDFKPENVLVGKDGRVRVVDFGIAALSDNDAEVAPRDRPEPSVDPLRAALQHALTQTGAIVGTPAYLAPERFRGERATPLCDQFAFCVSLYRAAYGAPPFPGQTIDEIIESMLEGEARPPGKSDAPAWLWPILRRGLAIEPAARFPSMAALLAAIDAQMPRPADLDRLAMRRERVQLAGLVSLVILGFGAYIVTHDREHALESPWAMVKFSIVATLAIGAAIFILRRRLLQNRYGQRLAAVFITPCFAWLAHRLVAQRFGTPPLHVLTVDLIFFGTVFGTAAITFEGWMGWVAVIALGGAAVSTARPELSPGMVLVVNLSAVVIGVLRWRRDG